MKVRLWVPHDRETWGRPRLIARDGSAPQPGRVFDVEAATRTEALRLVTAAVRPEPDMDKDPDAWVAWKRATARVAELEGLAPKEEPVD